jgi:hypothetical protein
MTRRKYTVYRMAVPGAQSEAAAMRHYSDLHFVNYMSVDWLIFDCNYMAVP